MNFRADFCSHSKIVTLLIAIYQQVTLHRKKLFQKCLYLKNETTWSSFLTRHSEPKRRRRGKRKGDRVSGSLSNFLRKRSSKKSKKVFKKVLTKLPKKFSIELFPLIRKLFEIYFVRLIGTPNQNSKNANSTSVG